MKKLLCLLGLCASTAAQPFWTPTPFMSDWPRQPDAATARTKLGVVAAPMLTRAALSGTKTLTVGTDNPVQVASSVASTPIFDLQDTSARNGDLFHVVNQSATASLAVNANGGLLKTVPADSWARFQWDTGTTDWVLISYGSL